MMRIINRSLRLLMPLALAALAALAPSQMAAAQDAAPQVRITQVDNSQFPKVTAYVSVTNAAGEPVGVDPSQIQIFENGSAMKFDTISGKGDIGGLTSMLVIDVSGSMLDAGKLDTAKAAAVAYVEQMRPGDQAGLMSFNKKVEYVQPVTQDRATLEAAINALKAHDDTAMYDALDQAVAALKDVNGRKAIIVMTDGLDNVSKTNADEVTKTIDPSGLSISTIGLGDPGQIGSNAGLDEAGLRALASRAGGIYGYANDPDSLKGLYEKYARALQSEYRITYTSPLALRDGANRTLTVSLGAQGAPGSAQAQYNPGGVLPEVAQNVSWPIFGGVLVALLVLLFVPFLITLGGQTLKGAGVRRGSKIKLSEPGGSTRKANIKLK